jgi:lycopene cyclase domain-containing protein
VAIPFLIWDVIFTEQGVWGFNEKYLVGYYIYGLPIEEILFFFCIPYASIFTHYALLYFFPKLKLSNYATKTLIISLLIASVLVLIYEFPKKYTTYNFLLFIALLLYSLVVNSKQLSQFFITFLIILIPFFIVNGLLTGSFIDEQIVWYDNQENLGIRLFTIPVEDVFYAFNMLYPAIILIEKFNLKFNSSKAIQ